MQHADFSSSEKTPHFEKAGWLTANTRFNSVAEIV